MTRPSHPSRAAWRPPRGTLALLGLAVAACAGAWWLRAAAVPDVRLPSGATWSMKFVGGTSVPDPETGTFPDRDVTTIYTRSIRVVDESRRPEEVLVEDAYRITDPVTGAISWEHITLERVDPTSGLRLEPEYRGQYAVFPRSVERREYVLRGNYMKGVPVRFVGEEEVEEVHTYVFSYKGPAEYTESYAGTERYPGVPVEAGQEIRCGDDRFSIKLWVEPVTGEIVKLHESCSPGDFIVDRATGRKIAPVLRWRGQADGDDVVRRATAIAAERSRILWRGTYGPALAALLGVAILALSFLPRRAPDAPPVAVEAA